MTDDNPLTRVIAGLLQDQRAEKPLHKMSITELMRGHENAKTPDEKKRYQDELDYINRLNDLSATFTFREVAERYYGRPL